MKSSATLLPLAPSLWLPCALQQRQEHVCCSKDESMRVTTETRHLDRLGQLGEHVCRAAVEKRVWTNSPLRLSGTYSCLFLIKSLRCNIAGEPVADVTISVASMCVTVVGMCAEQLEAFVDEVVGEPVVVVANSVGGLSALAFAHNVRLWPLLMVHRCSWLECPWLRPHLCCALLHVRMLHWPCCLARVPLASPTLVPCAFACAHAAWAMLHGLSAPGFAHSCAVRLWTCACCMGHAAWRPTAGLTLSKKTHTNAQIEKTTRARTSAANLSGTAQPGHWQACWRSAWRASSSCRSTRKG